MKKQFLAILSAVAVAGTVITAPLVSSQADEENEEIFSVTSDNYKSLIEEGKITQPVSAHGAPSYNSNEYNNGPCISAYGDYNDFGGIQIKLDGVEAGYVLSAAFQLRATGTGDVKVYLKQGATETVMLEQSADTNWTEYKTTNTATVNGSEAVYLCIVQESGLFYVADIKVYKTSGGVSTEQPSEQASAEPTNAPTATPAEGDWQEVLNHKEGLSDKLEMYGQYSSNSQIINDQWGGPSQTPCIHITGGSYQNPSGIKIDVSKLFRAGDSIRAEFKIKVTGVPNTIKAFVTDGTNTSEMAYSGDGSLSENTWIDYKTSPTEVKSENGNVYFCVTNESGYWYIMDLVLYKKSGETEPDKPTDTPAPTDTPTPTEKPTEKPTEVPTEKPTDEPTFTYYKAKFSVDGSLGDVIAGATLSEGGHVIKSADETSVVSVWKCLFTGDAPDGLYVTATSESANKTGHTTVNVGGTNTAIKSGAVTFYVLVNSAANDIKFDAKVHVE